MGSSSISFQTLVPNCKINTENATKVAKWIIVSKNSRLAQQRLKWLTGIVQYGLVESISGIQKCFSPIIQLIFTSELVSSIYSGSQSCMVSLNYNLCIPISMPQLATCCT